MKKSQTYSLTIVMLMTVVFSCQKESVNIPAKREPLNIATTSGLPARLDSLNGYLAAFVIYSKITYSLAPVLLTATCSFVDNGMPLMSKVKRSGMNFDYSELVNRTMDMGEVLCNGTPMSVGNYYQLASSDSMAVRPSLLFSAEGTSLVPGFETVIMDAFPTTTIPKDTLKVRISQGITVDPNRYFNDWDSVSLVVGNTGVKLPNISIYSSIGKGASFLRIDSTESRLLAPQTGRMDIRAFKYHYRVINDRRYVYETATFLRLPIILTN